MESMSDSIYLYGYVVEVVSESTQSSPDMRSLFSLIPMRRTPSDSKEQV